MRPLHRGVNSAQTAGRGRTALRPVPGVVSVGSPLALTGPDRTASLAQDVASHIGTSMEVLELLKDHSPMLARWGRLLAERLTGGARLLAAGNGGSAAEAQHLTAEIVGRYDGERQPFSAIALHGDSSAMTAIGNDYGYHEVFARQVRAHARAGDILILLSTSGKSQNLLAAAGAARECGALTWALTGPGPNPLSVVVDEALVLDGPNCHVQESQLVAIHALCACFDACVAGEYSGAERPSGLRED
ncbi:hypothetical protein GCM10027449_07330 [Sinomonas notoginsengisoli]|uniref:D-sedoheptulose-7-phosphate isomerase n=1 Tax=Sinomonas notoginsengisoli TaxID=1457311 RepID=UPI001F19680B|nr:SIS domain-containing protein [Sinomonas notoginsengisoli]